MQPRNRSAHDFLCRLIRTHGSLPSSLLYVVFFLPTSINAAWLSVASGLGVLIVPVSYGSTAHVEAEAVILAIVVTVAGNRTAMVAGMYVMLDSRVPATGS